MLLIKKINDMTKVAKPEKRKEKPQKIEKDSGDVEQKNECEKRADEIVVATFRELLPMNPQKRRATHTERLFQKQCGILQTTCNVNVKRRRAETKLSWSITPCRRLVRTGCGWRPRGMQTPQGLLALCSTRFRRL